MKFFFDVDDTLIHDKQPISPVIVVLEALVAAGHTVHVGSGGGMEYAKKQCEYLGIAHLVTIVPKFFSTDYDLCFDDQKNPMTEQIATRLVQVHREVNNTDNKPYGFYTNHSRKPKQRCNIT